LTNGRRPERLAYERGAEQLGRAGWIVELVEQPQLLNQEKCGVEPAVGALDLAENRELVNSLTLSASSSDQRVALTHPPPGSSTCRGRSTSRRRDSLPRVGVIEAEITRRIVAEVERLAGSTFAGWPSQKGW
jgi:hypothetical protein